MKVNFNNIWILLDVKTSLRYSWLFTRVRNANFLLKLPEAKRHEMKILAATEMS